MLRIQIRVQQAYRNGLDTLPGNLANRMARIFDVKRRVNRSIAKDSLGHLESQAPRHQRAAPKPVGILNIWAPLAAHLQIVPEAAGRDVTGRSCSAFDYRVRGDRRSMYEIIYVRRRSRLTNAFDYVLAHVIEQGKHLYRVNFSVVPENDHVGEGAADIKPHTHFSPFRAAPLSPHQAPPTRALLCHHCAFHLSVRQSLPYASQCRIRLLHARYFAAAAAAITFFASRLSASVRARSSVTPFGSIATPYTSWARSTEIFPSITSCNTSSASRSNGSPYPPEP